MHFLLCRSLTVQAKRKYGKVGNEMKAKIRPGVVLIPSLIFTIVIIAGLIDEKTFVAVLTQGFEGLMRNCGWMVSLGMCVFIVFLLVILFHPMGNIRLGGPNAKPKMSYWQWFTVALCAGIGTGIVFWGTVEPILFTMEPSPSLGMRPGSNEALIWAMRTSFLHWTITPYAIYVTFGLILSYVIHNMRTPQNVSSGFATFLGKKAENKTFALIIDILAVFAIVGGMSGSLGYGLLQLGRGFDLVFGFTANTWLYIAICLGIVIITIVTSVSGLKKGIAWLGDMNGRVYFVLLFFVLVTGPTAYIFNLMTQSTGSYISHFIESMTFTAPFPDSKLWPQWWDMYWWVDWLSYGPIMGLFFVRLAYGRTIRQFIIVNWLMPVLFGIIWFGFFGGTVLHAQIFDGTDLYGIYKASGAEAMLFATMDLLPLAAISKPVMIIVIAVSFITLANSMTSTIATSSMEENRDTREAPMYLKVFWAVLMGATSLIFTLAAGIDGIKMVKTFAGFPILFMGMVMVAGFVWHMSKRPRDTRGNYEYEDIIANAPDNGEEPIPPSPTGEKIEIWLKRKVKNIVE